MEILSRSDTACKTPEQGWWVSLASNGRLLVNHRFFSSAVVMASRVPSRWESALILAPRQSRSVVIVRAMDRHSSLVGGFFPQRGADW